MLNFLHRKSTGRGETKTQALLHHSQFSSFTAQGAGKHGKVWLLCSWLLRFWCAGRRDLVRGMRLAVPHLLQSTREGAYADGSGPRATSGPPARESQPLTGLFFWGKKWLNVGSHRKYFLKFYLWILIFNCLQYLLCFLITVLTLECLNCFLVKLKLWNSDVSLSKK